MGSEENFTEIVVHIKRVVKVTKGGKNFSFCVLVVVGDGNGRVGFSWGKDKEIIGAKTKAVRKATKSMIRVPLREGRTLHHDLQSYYCASKVVMRSAPAGTGIIAGGAVRSIVEALGVKDIVVKSINTTTSCNVVRSVFKAFSMVDSPKYIAKRRGKAVGDIISRRRLVEGC